MPKTLVIDGIRFNLWIPEHEKEQFHPIIKEHSKEIFGQDAVYFDIGLRLKSEAGLGAEPDAIVIDPIVYLGSAITFPKQKARAR
jgi:hypothetical protein